MGYNNSNLKQARASSATPWIRIWIHISNLYLGYIMVWLALVRYGSSLLNLCCPSTNTVYIFSPPLERVGQYFHWNVIHDFRLVKLTLLFIFIRGTIYNLAQNWKTAPEQVYFAILLPTSPALRSMSTDTAYTTEEGTSLLSTFVVVSAQRDG